MTINHTFTDWPNVAHVGPDWQPCSPNLIALAHALHDKWGTTSIGCYGVRPIRLGVVESTHSFGAAIDISYRDLDRATVRSQMIGYLVGNSAEWNVSAIHDYLGCRIWRAGRTLLESDACSRWWKAQRPDEAGMGQPWGDWLHIETTMAGWRDARTAPQRGVL